MILNKRLQTITFGIWLGIILTGNAFGGEIYSCVDKEGKRRIQNNPCSSKEKTIDRQVFTESSQQVAPGKVDSRTGLTTPKAVTEADRAIAAQENYARSQMQEVLNMAQQARDTAPSVSSGNAAYNAVIHAFGGRGYSRSQMQEVLNMAQQARATAPSVSSGNAAYIAVIHAFGGTRGIAPPRALSSAGGIAPPRAEVFSQPVPPVFSPPAPQRNVGQCMGGCASEQGMCISQCRGNGQCISNCAASNGRCVARCN